LTEALQKKPLFLNWYRRNVKQHKRPGYAIATIALKETGTAPGDVTDAQLEHIADLSDEYSFGEARVSHRQNVVLAVLHKKNSTLYGSNYEINPWQAKIWNY